MTGQMDIFDCWPDLFEPEPGEFVTKHGQAIPHAMRKGYIGKKIVVDRSTQSHEWYQVGILEKYIPYEKMGFWRAIIYVGKKDRLLYTTYDGGKIYELKPWNWEERKKKLEERKRGGN